MPAVAAPRDPGAGLLMMKAPRREGRLNLRRPRVQHHAGVHAQNAFWSTLGQKRLQRPRQAHLRQTAGRMRHGQLKPVQQREQIRDRLATGDVGVRKQGLLAWRQAHQACLDEQGMRIGLDDTGARAFSALDLCAEARGRADPGLAAAASIGDVRRPSGPK